MIKVTIRNYPTNYTSNQVRTFNDLETAIKTVRRMDTIMVAIEEEGVGFHKVPLTKDGSVALSGLSYGTPTGGSMYESEKFKEIEKKISEENNKPKLA